MSEATKKVGHTPGPWIHGPCRDMHNKKHDRTQQVWATDTDMVCEVNKFADTAESDANARLIAAAPELLEACRWLLAQLDGTHTQDFGEQCANQNKAIELGKAAIAKATGGSQ